jgi:hypothetical protein
MVSKAHFHIFNSFVVMLCIKIIHTEEEIGGPVDSY